MGRPTAAITRLTIMVAERDKIVGKKDDPHAADLDLVLTYLDSLEDGQPSIDERTIAWRVLNHPAMKAARLCLGARNGSPVLAERLAAFSTEIRKLDALFTGGSISTASSSQTRVMEIASIAAARAEGSGEEA